jgi:hypothetical protein
MPKNKRRRSTPTPPPADNPAVQAGGLPEWRWMTFPVFFAFFAGALVMAVLNGSPGTGAAAIAQWIVLAGVSYGFARIFVRKVFAERRASRRADPDTDYEEVVVYPEERTAPR